MFFKEYKERLDSLEYNQKVLQVLKDTFDTNAVPENKRIPIFIGKVKPNEFGQGYTFVENIRTLQGNPMTKYPYEGMRSDINVFFLQKNIVEPIWIAFTVELGNFNYVNELFKVESWVSFERLEIDSTASINQILLALAKNNRFEKYLPNFETLSYEEFLEKKVEIEQTHKKLDELKSEVNEWKKRLDWVCPWEGIAKGKRQKNIF